jgi:hypothetical protein
MTGKEKIHAALSPGGTPEPAVIIPYPGICYRDHLRKLTQCPWWYSQSYDLSQRLQWYDEVFKSIPDDWMELPHLSKHCMEANQIETRNGIPFHINLMTGEEYQMGLPQISGNHVDIRSNINTFPDTYEKIDILFSDWEQRLEQFNPKTENVLAPALRSGPGCSRFLVSYIMAPLWGLMEWWGVDKTMEQIFLNPTLIQYACNRYTHCVKQQIMHEIDQGVDGIFIEACLFDAISPLHYQELVMPSVKELVTTIHEQKRLAIYYFTGDPLPKIDMLKDSGVDALWFEESKKGFTIQLDEVVHQIEGTCSLIGNVDSYGVLECGSDEVVRDAIYKQSQVAKSNGGRFVFSLGSPVTPGTSLERVRFFCEEVHRQSL